MTDHATRTSNVLWTNFQHRDGVPKRTRPKPDLVYGFPAFTGADTLPDGFKDDESARLFSYENLRDLPESIVFSPSNNFSKVLCFPWAVLEVKRAQNSLANVCHCQAANAAAAVLEWRKSLFNRAYQEVGKPPPVPLVIAYTCVGTWLRVWLAYYIPGKDHAIVGIPSIKFGVDSYRLVNVSAWFAFEPPTSNYHGACCLPSWSSRTCIYGLPTN